MSGSDHDRCIAECGLRNVDSCRTPIESARNPQSEIRICHSSRFANTIAPIIATSSSIDAISNGIR